MIRGITRRRKRRKMIETLMQMLDNKKNELRKTKKQKVTSLNQMRLQNVKKQKMTFR